MLLSLLLLSPPSCINTLLKEKKTKCTWQKETYCNSVTVLQNYSRLKRHTPMRCPVNTGKRTKSESPGDREIRSPYYPVGRLHNPPKAANTMPSQKKDWQNIFLYQRIFRYVNSKGSFQIYWRFVKMRLIYMWQKNGKYDSHAWL